MTTDTPFLAQDIAVTSTLDVPNAIHLPMETHALCAADQPHTADRTIAHTKYQVPQFIALGTLHRLTGSPTHAPMALTI